MTERDIETERMHWVFGWTGGEAQDEPWDKIPAEYWMEGAPDYAEEYNSRADPTGIYRTAIGYMVETLKIPGWEQVARFPTSGETDCPACGAGTDYASEHGGEHDDACEMCEGDGYLYIGDGYAEHVMRATGVVADPPKIRPGRYEGAGRIIRVLHLLAEHGADEETGDANDGPGYFLLVSDGKRADDERIERWHRGMDGDETLMLLSPDEREELRASAGAILSIDSQGFHDGRLFDSPAALEDAWMEVESEVEEFYAELDSGD